VRINNMHEITCPLIDSTLNYTATNTIPFYTAETRSIAVQPNVLRLYTDLQKGNDRSRR